jgi:hypothetical protein
VLKISFESLGRQERTAEAACHPVVDLLDAAARSADEVMVAPVAGGLILGNRVTHVDM